MKRSILVLLALLGPTAGLRAAAPQPPAECRTHDFNVLERAARLALAATDLAPGATGSARVAPSGEQLEIRVDVAGLGSPSAIRPEYLTYVLWSVDPSGAWTNLGELRAEDGKSRLAAERPRGPLELVVTAEPYFAVAAPAAAVVLRSGADGDAAAACRFLPDDAYAFGRSATDLAIQLKPGPRTPVELLQARNARRIAELAGAARDASEPFAVASAKLVDAEQAQALRPGGKGIAPLAQEAVIAAEQALRVAEAQRIEREHREHEAAERAAEQARQRAAQEAEALAAQQRQLDEERVKRERAEQELEARAARQQELEAELSAQRGRVPVAVEAAPQRVPADAFGSPNEALASERARLEAERARLEAERVHSQADLAAERARLESDRADLRARVAADQAAQDKQEHQTVRAELEQARREAEQARLEAQLAKRDAETAAERAQLQMEQARLQAELKTREAELAARNAEVEQAAGTPQQLEAAEAERARLAEENRVLQEELAAERTRVAGEQQAGELALANERSLFATEQARLEADRAKLELERMRLQAELEAERSMMQRTRDEHARKQADEQSAAQQRLREEQEAAARERDQDLAQRRAELEAERQKMMADIERRRASIEGASIEAERARAERDAAERVARRARLLGQLTEVLEAMDTERGLLLNMADVSFRAGQFVLEPAAREKLARISGILLAHPDLRLAIEGHTDATGSPESNQLLSEKRALAVRDFLASQGVSPAAMTALGFGQTRPVAPNDSAEGRRANRRIDIVVSGDPIAAAQVPGT